MKKIISFFLGVLCFLLINSLLTGYGNRVVHPTLNQLMYESFHKSFIVSANPDVRFKNYTFVFDGSPTFSGSEVSKGGFLLIKEQETEKTPLKWIIHGGFSADEPEIYASFRHFYDPIEPEGNRYLHNHLDNMPKLNPKIDHLEWALDHPEHHYNWENGIAAMEMGMSTSSEEVRTESFAFAYRALGETLHMIADMGCPSHVRDDAHAAEPFTGYKFGSPDPYEEYFEEFTDIKGSFSAGKVDQKLRTRFRAAANLEDIAKDLAEYTNENFFTTQTISGREIVPLIHPEKTYASPKLEECEYDDLSYTYTKDVSGNEVMMCKDLRYRIGIFANRGYPYIDKECTLSQGTALVPQILEAGANTIRLYFPLVEVKITDYDPDGKVITGVVKHKVNEVYKQEIFYSGKVRLFNAKTLKAITTVNCDDGEIDAAINPGDFRAVDWEKSGIYAEIEFGGIYVRSDPFKTSLEVNLSIKPDPLEGGVGQEITMQVLADGPVPEKAKYTWNFGDGSLPVSVSNGNSVKHTYAKEGSYTVTVELSDQATSKKLAETSAIARISLTGPAILPFQYTWQLSASSTWPPIRVAYTIKGTVQGLNGNKVMSVKENEYQAGVVEVLFSAYGPFKVTFSASFIASPARSDTTYSDGSRDVFTLEGNPKISWNTQRFDPYLFTQGGEGVYENAVSFGSLIINGGMDTKLQRYDKTGKLTETFEGPSTWALGQIRIDK
jgi:PKD repeat protein